VVVTSSLHVVIVGGGFAGLNVAKGLGGVHGVKVTLIDRRNHHLFQPLLYQVATAGLSPAEIAAPIRGLLSKYENVRVLQGEVTGVDLAAREVTGSLGTLRYDRLVLAAGAMHSYFGSEAWEVYAPGLKTVEQATEIRRRVLEAYEAAEHEEDSDIRRALLTFVVVGGGPTGVEIAGALGEMSRFTLARDFRNIDPALARIVLIEAGERILATFAPRSSSRATRDLERLGVQVWTGSRVSAVDAEGVEVGDERIAARTVVWAAGVKASEIGGRLAGGDPVALDRQGRVRVNASLQIPGHPSVFVLGDQAHVQGPTGDALPGVAPVAMQQGRYVSRRIRAGLKAADADHPPFVYWDKGQMATIGRSRAVLEAGRIRMGGMLAWLGWLFVHIYYLSGFKNRLFVLFSWAWSYLSFARGARLIIQKNWRSYGGPPLQGVRGSTDDS
jgi:NADH dehydrogenase